MMMTMMRKFIDITNNISEDCKVRKSNRKSKIPAKSVMDEGGCSDGSDYVDELGNVQDLKYTRFVGPGGLVLVMIVQFYRVAEVQMNRI